MAKIPIRINRAVREGNYLFGKHCLEALADDGLDETDAIRAVLSADECTLQTDDESHHRWVIYGSAKDGRAIDIVVTMHQGKVIFETAYES